jgi:hypothetical protein
MTTSSNNRQSTVHHNGVPDLTPHINDPLEHIRNAWKGFCGNNLDLGDRRPPPVVTIEAQQARSPQMCGYLCMDSQSKVVQPCVPSCSDEQGEIPLSAEASVTNGHHRSHATNNRLMEEDDDDDIVEAPKENIAI